MEHHEKAPSANGHYCFIYFFTKYFAQHSTGKTIKRHHISSHTFCDRSISFSNGLKSWLAAHMPEYD